VSAPQLAGRTGTRLAIPRRATSFLQTPLVSVVVPTYNRGYCLARTVDSALAQTYPAVEVIIVDDGSQDDTAQVIAARYRGDARVRLIRQANAGVAAARNIGMRAGRGEYLALLDSDDVWEPWKLELQVACMRARPEVGMTWTEMVAVDPAGQVIDARYLRRMYSAYRWFPTSSSLFNDSLDLATVVPALAGVVSDRRFSVGDLSSAIVMGNLVHTSTVVLTRQRAQSVGGFPEQYRHGGEDYPFHLRTCRLGPVGYLDVASIRYQRGFPDRLTRSENQLHMARAFLNAIRPIIQTERDTLTLPPRMIRAVLAEAHGWIGQAALDAGQMLPALEHLARSIFYRPLQPRLLRRLSLAPLPPNLINRVRSLYRAAKRKVKGAARIQAPAS
jgi:glycosyltransferase involved in cell wall biosynthesis